MKKSKRRDFLKSLGAIGIGTAVIAPLSSFVANSDGFEDGLSEEIENSKKEHISILQTTDVHCQIHPHDELFWEKETIIFRKTGGYAYMASLIEAERKKNKNTFVLDTGDMFQGSELSVKTTGASLVPILNDINYLYLINSLLNS
jgi:2',3'-cyclic-nucleotide 2'-phosphodiesterase (5'-nucleotidase family)